MTVYGNAFSTMPGRCFRLVYEESTTRPMHCPDEPQTRAWWRDSAGLWWVVDACAHHADHLSSMRPGPGARLGTLPLNLGPKTNSPGGPGAHAA